MVRSVKLGISKDVAAIGNLEAFAAALLRCGKACRVAALSELPDAVVLSEHCGNSDEDFRNIAEKNGLPIIKIGDSWTGGGVALSEVTAETGYKNDLRPARLFHRFADRLREDCREAAASALSDQSVLLGQTFAALSENMTPLLEAAREAGFESTDQSNAARAIATDQVASIWRALARGQEVLQVDGYGPASLGLIHEVKCYAALDDAMTALATEKRNTRDRTRALLAIERIFNVLPPVPEAIAAAIADAAEAHCSFPEPRYSVVVTAYNYGAFVGDAIRSVQAQSLAAHEIIVVDDGSTDGTADILRGFDGIDVVCKANGGQASAFNAGFERTSGEVVLFLDADDRLNQGALQRLSQMRIGDASRLQFLLETINTKGHPTGLHPACHRAAAGDLRGALRSDGVFWFMPTSGNAFPRDVLEKVLPMPVEGFEIAADLYLVLAAALLGPVAHVPEVLAQYRVHGENAYFHAEAGAPYLEDRRSTLRARAWRHLSERLPQLVSCGERERYEREFQRLLHRRSDVDEHHPAAEERCERRKKTVCRTDDDLIALAGRAHWPMLETGTTIRFTAPRAGASPVGQGWADPGPCGAILMEDAGTIAFRLPWPETDWTILLDYALPDDQPLLGVTFRLNGQILGLRDLLRDGLLTLRLPVILMPAAERGGRACCLSIETSVLTQRAFALRGLTVDRIFESGHPAPVLSDTEWHPVRPGSRGAACLGAGWNWPEEHGVRPARNRATIALSVADQASRRILLCWTKTTEVRALIGAHKLTCRASPASNTTVIELPEAFIPPDGRLVINLILSNGTETPSLVAICQTICVTDALDIARPQPLPDLIGSQAAERTGLALVPAGVRPDGSRMVWTMPAPALPQGTNLCLEILRTQNSAEPRTCRITTEYHSCKMTLGARSLLRLPVSRRDGSGHLRCGVDVCDVATDLLFPTASIDVTCPRRRPVEAMTQEALEASDLELHAEMSSEWHAAVEGALWLAAPMARLHLPKLSPTTTSLSVSTLTLGEPFPQVLSVFALSRTGDVIAKSRTDREGIQSIELAWSQQSDTPVWLRVQTDHMVSADLIGGDECDMLGGAILSVGSSSAM